MEKVKIAIEKLGLGYSIFIVVYLVFMLSVPVIYHEKMAIHGHAGYFTVTTIILILAIGQKIFSIRKEAQKET